MCTWELPEWCVHKWHLRAIPEWCVHEWHLRAPEWCVHEWHLRATRMMFAWVEVGMILHYVSPHFVVIVVCFFLALRMISKTWRCKLVPQSYPSCDHLGICRTLRIHALNMYLRFIPHSQKAFSSHHVPQVLSQHWYEMALMKHCRFVFYINKQKHFLPTPMCIL